MAYWDLAAFLIFFDLSAGSGTVTSNFLKHSFFGFKCDPVVLLCLLHLGRFWLWLTFYSFSVIVSNLIASTKSLWDSDTKFLTVPWTSSLGYSIVTLLNILQWNLPSLVKSLLPIHVSHCCHSVKWVWNLDSVPHPLLIHQSLRPLCLLFRKSLLKCVPYSIAIILVLSHTRSLFTSH